MKDFFEGVRPDLEAVGIDSKEIENFRPGFKGDVESPLSAREKAIEEGIKAVTGADGDQYPEKKTLQAIDKKIVEQEQKSSQDLAKKQKSLEIQKRIATIDTEVNRLHNTLEIIEREKRKLLLEKTEERWQRYLVYFDNLRLEQEILEALYGSLRQTLGSGSKEERSLEFYIKWKVDTAEWSNFGESLLDRRKRGPYRAPGEIAAKAEELLEDAWTKGDKDSVRKRLQELRGTFDDTLGRYTLDSQLLSNNEAKFDDWLYSTEHITLTYGIKYDGIELENLTPGTKGIVLLILYLEMDKNDRRPLLIDQPEENLDNESVYKVLTSYFRKAKQRRQIILITHNPNLVVNTDSEASDSCFFCQGAPSRGCKNPLCNGLLGGLSD